MSSITRKCLARSVPIAVLTLSVVFGALIGCGGSDGPTQPAVPSSTVDLVFVPTSLSVDKTTVSPGGTIQVGVCQVKNQGSAAAGPFHEGIFLSTDAAISASDTKLASIANAGLASGGTCDESGPLVTIPAATPNGTYWLGMLCDCDAEVVESNESNNTVAVQITVQGPVQNGPDLLVTSGALALSRTTVEKGGSIEVGPVTIGNAGATASVESGLQLLFSLDAAPSADDVALLLEALAPIAPSGSVQRARFTVTIPSQTSTGVHHLILVVDPLSQVAETNESNNTAEAAIDVQESGCDLVIVGQPAITPATVVAGDLFDVGSWQVRNIGSAATSAGFNCAFFLSSDAAWDGGDPLLSSNVVVGVLNAGATHSVSATSLTLPPATAAGNWHVILKVDVFQQVTEWEESNNTLALPFNVQTPTPDLIITVPAPLSTTPDPVVAGDPVTLSAWSVKNQGTGPAGAFQCGYYLSTDPIVTDTDLLLAQESIGSLARGATRDYAPKALTIPAATAGGTYYLGLMADLQDAVAEGSNENNNTKSVQIHVTGPQPDLVATSTAAPTVTPNPVVSGNNVTLSAWSIRNDGTGNAGAFRYGYYLSLDAVITTADTPLATEAVAGLARGAVLDVAPKSLAIPAKFAPGARHVGVLVDYEGVIPEASEANNLLSATLDVQGKPDLVIDPPTLSSTSGFDAGSNAALSSWRVKNVGDWDCAIPFTAKVFLSTDALITPDDTDLGYSISVSSLAKAASSGLGPTSILIPASTTGGAYYIGVLADVTGAVAEWDEANNHVSAPITIVTLLPDLAINGSITGNRTTLRTRETIQINQWTARNLTAKPAAACKFSFYLSADPTITTGDTPLATGDIPAIDASASVNLAGPLITIPDGTSPGSWYVGVIVDKDGTVAEKNEANNTAAMAITISGQPDLVVTAANLSVNTTVYAGGSVKVSFTVKNNGNTSSTECTYKIYFSGCTWNGNRCLSIFPLPVNASGTIPALGPGGTWSSSWTYAAPAPGASTATGVLAWDISADTEKVVWEFDESNNSKSTPSVPFDWSRTGPMANR